jgi:hypothetical protein
MSLGRIAHLKYAQVAIADLVIVNCDRCIKIDEVRVGISEFVPGTIAADDDVL